LPLVLLHDLAVDFFEGLFRFHQRKKTLALADTGSSPQEGLVPIYPEEARLYLLRLSIILFASSKTVCSAASRLGNLPHMLNVPKYPCMGLNFALASMKSPLSLVDTSIS